MKCETYHCATISGRNSVYESPPDVEVLAGTAYWIRSTSVTKVCTRLDIVLVEESEALSKEPEDKHGKTKWKRAKLTM